MFTTLCPYLREYLSVAVITWQASSRIEMMGPKHKKVYIRSYSSGNPKFSCTKTGQYKWLRIKMLQKLFHYFIFTGINTKSKIFVVNNSYRIWNFLSLSSIKMLIEHLLSEQVLPTRNILCFCWQSRFKFLRL